VVSLLVLAALAAPFGAAAHGMATLVGPLSKTTADLLLALVAPLAAPEPAPPVDAVRDGEPAPLAPELLPVAGPVGSARRGSARPAPRAKPAALFVSQATVLKLAESAARPQGAFVPRTAEHPAGLRLAGVGALGIGVQDGDILVEALGVAPRSPGDIIGAVLQARAQNARFLSGTLWRRGDTFRITVEQPYLPAPAKG
jgi:hypothetical protein